MKQKLNRAYQILLSLGRMPRQDGQGPSDVFTIQVDSLGEVIGIVGEVARSMDNPMTTGEALTQLSHHMIQHFRDLRKVVETEADRNRAQIVKEAGEIKDFMLVPPEVTTGPDDQMTVGVIEINQLCGLSLAAHAMAVSKGWWNEDRGVPECLALIHSEVSEALEDYRNGLMSTVLHMDGGLQIQPEPKTFLDYASAGAKPEGFPIELADILIRIFDLAGRLNIDLDQAVAIKMAYNATRPERHGGKKA